MELTEDKTMTLGTNFDLLTIADAGELYRVEDGTACLLSRASIPTVDDRFGREWVLVKSPDGAVAKRIARMYDEKEGYDLHGQDLCALEVDDETAEALSDEADMDAGWSGKV